MEHLLRAFTRVARKLDEADSLISSFPDLEKAALSDPSSMPDQDRRRLLDFPDREMQLSNIAACSSLDKTELLKRAVDSPRELTRSEIDLLKERYWMDVSRQESRGRISANSKLLEVSEDYWQEVTDRLKRAREPLYETNEWEATEGAQVEHLRRLIEETDARREKEVESSLARARPWIRRLWEEDRGRKCWGYVMFTDPEIETLSMSEYWSRQGGALFNAKIETCCPSAIRAQWRIQLLDWPEATTAEEDVREELAEGDEHEVEEDEEEAEKEVINERQLLVKFQKLREEFIAIRDRAAKRRKTDEEGAKSETGGLQDGILHNVFLVIDQGSVDSVLSKTGWVDDMWVWAVDPEYIADISASLEALEKDEYCGYLKVRLQQLVNNFFEARRFRGDLSMQKLWEAAQKSRNKAFVSVNVEEVGAWGGSRLVGSAIKP